MRSTRCFYFGANRGAQSRLIARSTPDRLIKDDFTGSCGNTIERCRCSLTNVNTNSVDRLTLLLWFSTARIPRQRIGRGERTTSVFLLSLKLHAVIRQLSINPRYGSLGIDPHSSANMRRDASEIRLDDFFDRFDRRRDWWFTWRLPSSRLNYPLNLPWTHHRLPFNMRNAIYAIAHDSRRDSVNRICDSFPVFKRATLSLSRYILQHYLLTVQSFVLRLTWRLHYYCTPICIL